MSHKNEAIEKINVLTTQGKMGRPLRDAEAPRKRSLGGLVRHMAQWKATPEVRVWTGPAFRALGICGVLCCVAFLGEHSEKETMYGAPVGLGPSDGSPKINEPEKEPHERVLEHFHEDEPARTHTAPEAPSPCVPAEVTRTSGGITAEGRVIMNEASQSEFTELPRVGEARAEAIVKLRERMGKFKSINDLLRVRGIGWKTLQAMKDRLVVDRPSEEVSDVPEEKSSEDKNTDEKGAGEKGTNEKVTDQKSAGDA